MTLGEGCGIIPLITVRVTQPWQERFWRFVQKTPTCWEWVGAKNGLGYGVLGKGGRRAGNIKAHRASYLLNRGSIPEGLFVCHACDNPSCVRPDHLFLGTALQNWSDAHKKGRTGLPPRRVGTTNSNSKLTNQQVEELRQLYHPPPRRRGRVAYHAKLAARYGVDKSTIHNILTKRQWKGEMFP